MSPARGVINGIELRRDISCFTISFGGLVKGLFKLRRTPFQRLRDLPTEKDCPGPNLDWYRLHGAHRRRCELLPGVRPRSETIEGAKTENIGCIWLKARNNMLECKCIIVALESRCGYIGNDLLIHYEYIRDSFSMYH